jgi:hypothetical protein
MGNVLLVILPIIAFVYGLFTCLEMAFMPRAHCVHIASLSYPFSGEVLVT